MRVLSILLPLLSASHLGVAAPLIDDGSLEFPSQDVSPNELHPLALRSPSEAHNVMVRLESRALICSPLNGQALRVIRDTTAQLAFLNVGAHFAAEVCEHYHFDDCAWWISKIQWAMNTIFAISAARGRVNGADGVSPDQQLQSIDARSLSNTSYADTINQWLHDERFNYDTVEDVDILTITHQKRSHDEPDLMHRAIIRGIKNNGFTHDVAFNYYSNGGTVLHLGAANETLAANPSDLSKRTGFGHEGFKISFTTRQPTALTNSQQDDMAGFIARNWASHVFAASDYIGLVKDGHKADFYYRIIPEVLGFGLNYESVDVCGGMAGLL